MHFLKKLSSLVARVFFRSPIPWAGEWLLGKVLAVQAWEPDFLKSWVPCLHVSVIPAMGVRWHSGENRQDPFELTCWNGNKLSKSRESLSHNVVRWSSVDRGRLLMLTSDLCTALHRHMHLPTGILQTSRTSPL